jgi:hypothetical protein
MAVAGRKQRALVVAQASLEHRHHLRRRHHRQAAEQPVRPGELAELILERGEPGHIEADDDAGPNSDAGTSPMCLLAIMGFVLHVTAPDTSSVTHG